MATLKELRDERIKKLNKLKSMGFNPFTARTKKDVSNNVLLNKFSDYENKEVTIAGRIMSIREHGQLVFMDLVDTTGKVQLYIKESELAQTNLKNATLGFSELNLLDIGDFIQVHGVVTKTNTGQISLLSKEIKILTKAIRPLPDKHEGLKDQDTIFRRRYLDLIMNPEKKELFERKAKFWKTGRDFLHNECFIEVETPVLEHITGGADAKPFITHHDALDEDFYLRISTELFQKRLIGGGFEKIYTFGPNFRNEGLSDEHLQEYYSIEWYWAYASYRDNMELVKRLFREMALKVYGKTKFVKNEYSFDLADEWKELDYTTVIKEKFGVDVFTTPDEEMLKILKENKVKLPGTINRIRLIDNLWKLIRKEIAGPAFLINHPKFISPLAKSLKENESLTERFQVIIAGSELGNGYSELNDPFDQLERFKEQQSARDQGDEEAQMLDIDFVEMLEYGMPPTSGFGMSERFFWALENVTAREGTLFPQMRKKIDDVSKEIYGLKDKATSMESKNNNELKDRSSIQNSSNKNMFTNTEKYEEQANQNLKMGGKLQNKNNDVTKEEAQQLLDEHVKDEYQKLHALMVAKALEEYASKLGENPNLWYITGLLHDLDYYAYPDQHPQEELKWFGEWSYPEELQHAIKAHAHRITGFEPQSNLASALLSIDELAGFLYAYSLMRPEGFEGMEASSVKKKFKDKAFAKKIDREDISYGVEKFNVDLTEHINFLISVFQKMKELKK